MFQYIFNQSLSQNKIRSKLYTQLIKLVLKYRDPIVYYSLNNNRIKLNLSHQLPFYKKHFPLYSDNLRRLSLFIREYFGNLCMIDIGANIGDSYYLSNQDTNDTYILI